MSRIITNILIISAIILFVEFYAFQALKTITKSRVIKWSWVIIALAVYINFFYTIFSTPRSLGQTLGFQYASGFLLMFLVPKAILLIVMFGEDYCANNL